jgi:Rrf2 family transcriptional regulator, iron-sulfur cluster assembly transcription factor
MQFTKAEEYGILGVIYLAEKDMNKVTPLSEISNAQDIPEKFLAKIFQSLSKTGIIRSHRGVRGGFSLAKEPDDIGILDILEAIQGPYHLMKCTNNRSVCEKEGFCSLRELLVMAEDQLVSVFGKYTLNDLKDWQQNSNTSAQI